VACSGGRVTKPPKSSPIKRRLRYFWAACTHRMILGGNLIGGWAYSRDLICVSSLFKAYNNEKKVLETLDVAECALPGAPKKKHRV
jgi:hypothetical protein